MKIRRAIEADVPEMLALHREAVLRTAAGFYEPEIIDAWSPGATPERFAGLADEIKSANHIVLVAVEGDIIMGFGEVLPEEGELRAIYVHPDHGRKGIGGQLMSALETLAKEQGTTELHMSASLNAEDFYARHGFEVVERSEHILRTGLKMPCVKMRKII